MDKRELAYKFRNSEYYDFLLDLFAPAFSEAIQIDSLDSAFKATRDQGRKAFATYVVNKIDRLAKEFLDTKKG